MKKFYKQIRKNILALSQICFCKEFLGNSFFGDAVDIDIHEEQKNELTTKFKAKGRISNSAIFLKLNIFLLFFYSNFSLGATIQINDTTPVNTSTLAGGDIVNFNVDGKLNVNSNLSLSSISTFVNAQGKIDFTSTNALTVTGNVGAQDKKLNDIVFSSDGTLDLRGNIFLANGIKNNVTNNGTINLSDTLDQTLQTSIGTSTNKIKNIAITNSSRYVEFSGDVYAEGINFSGNNLIIQGSGNINSTTSNVGENAKITSSVRANLGQLTISANKTLTLENDYTESSKIILNTQGQILVRADKNLVASGDIEGSGLIAGISNGNSGSLTFSGTNSQNVQAGVQIGKSDNFVNKLVVNNSSAGGVTFNNDVFTKSIDFSGSSSRDAKASIVSGKSINLSGDISGGVSKYGIVTGSGSLNLNSDKSQSIESRLGVSSADRLANLNISNTNSANKISINNDAFLSSLNINSAIAIENNSQLDVSNLNINQDVSWTINGATNIGNVVFDSNNRAISLQNSNSLNIAGDVSGSGTIKGSASGVGSVNFIGSVKQTVASGVNIGASTTYLSKISSKNTSVDGVEFNNDVYANDIDFTNSSGDAKISVVTGKTLYVSKNISQSGASASTISGAGTLDLSGSAKQTIDSKIGSSSSRFATLKINNNSGVLLNQDSYVDNFQFDGGNVIINDNKILDVTNNINLVNKVFTSRFVNQNFGKINVGGQAIVDASSKIMIDYSNYSGATSGALDVNGNTEYLLLSSGSQITNAQNIVIEDNSYLVDNQIQLANGNKEIRTKVVFSSNYSKSVIGEETYSIINRASSFDSQLMAGLISIDNKDGLNKAVNSIKPIANEVLTNQLMANTNNIFDIALSHAKSISLDEEYPSRFNKKKLSKSTWWQLFNNNSQQKLGSYDDKYGGTHTGFVLGADKLIKNGESNVIIGGAVSFVRSSLTNDFKNKDIKVNSYNLLLYNNNSTRDNFGLFNKNLLLIGFNNFQTQRKIEAGTYKKTANARYNGYTFSLESSAGYNQKINNNIAVAPFVGVQYFSLLNSGYDEKNAGNSAIKYGNNYYNQIISKVGLEIVGKYSYDLYKIIPILNFSWDRNLMDKKLNNSYSYVGDSSEIKSNNELIQRNKFNIGLGFDLVTKELQKIRIKSNLQLSSKYINYGGFIEYSWEF